PEALAVTASKRAEPRIPFGALVERGLVPPGAFLFDPTGRHAARVRADGTLAVDGASGSIHRIGAHVQRAEACNGWVFWHTEVNGARVPIDVFRQKLRAELTE
ncbi:MAG TPA: site-specific DNA-methyltransferase, partial [Phenylobacterium sp.]